MGRPLRLEFEGATYHVTSRGNRRAAIVVDDVDRAAWLVGLQGVTVRRGWEVLAFVLMDNHFHLFVRTPRPDLAKGMQQFLSGYASRFAVRWRVRGHVFQGRYDAQLVEGESYFWTVARYVALNPVRAGMVARPQDWPWSSHADLAAAAPRMRWLARAALLAAWDGSFGGGAADALAAYRTYVETADAHTLRSPFDDAWQGWILGGESFVKRLHGLLDRSPPDLETPRDRRLRAASLGEVETAVCRALGADPAALRDGRAGRDARRVFVAVARRVTVATHGEVAQRLGLARPQGAATLLRRAGAEPRLGGVVDRVVADLGPVRLGKEEI